MIGTLPESTVDYLGIAVGIVFRNGEAVLSGRGACG